MSTNKNEFESTSPRIAEDLNRSPNITTERSVNKISHTSRSLTTASSTIVQLPTEHGKQRSLTSETLFDDHNKDKL
jgi:hypothetical protein